MRAVASLELSRTLFELSGWAGTRDSYQSYTHEVKGKNYDRWSLRTPKINNPSSKASIPAYDLGYLQRKCRGYLFMSEATTIMLSEHPEDDLAKIAIQRIKDGEINVASN